LKEIRANDIILHSGSIPLQVTIILAGNVDVFNSNLHDGVKKV